MLAWKALIMTAVPQLDPSIRNPAPVGCLLWLCPAHSCAVPLVQVIPPTLSTATTAAPSTRLAPSTRAPRRSRPATYAVRPAPTPVPGHGTAELCRHEA